MNVVLEIDAAQVLSSLANTDDPLFNQALRETIVQNRRGSSSDFITLFHQNYERINPQGRLANIYSVTMSERVSPTASNNDVISVLRNELVSVADNSFNVLATRIDRFGVVAVRPCRTHPGGITGYYGAGTCSQPTAGKCQSRVLENLQCQRTGYLFQ